MYDFSLLYRQLEDVGLESWVTPLSQQITNKLNPLNHGDLPRWYDALDQLPDIRPTSIELNRSAVTIGQGQDAGQTDLHTLIGLLKEFKPWRKGPFELFGIDINTEWRSDMKWNRLADSIAPLAGRTVLDVGCGNGYHILRMIGEGAKLAIGIDPTLLFNMQFQALQKYINSQSSWVIPLALEELPQSVNAFDTVFSMGVLYHRRSPIDHLIKLKELIRPGGELVLETLVIEGTERDVLIPSGRYAKMRNVWFIPSGDALRRMLARCGFREIKKIDISVTTTAEQRSTDWMSYESLTDFLDPLDSSKTIEGLPAPRRAIYIAKA
ncbi:MAG: tRNA 5-methoxyuridine(34)/uridine 5-oxyacetic acid(34) synthase CmoB [Pseudomonadales bacterium]|nr:tRNA 5-methoxyuridine(34)/uridine 5-oxyacetic acid(34) synthase CmoB [Pseudomonadales bacterium]